MQLEGFQNYVTNVAAAISGHDGFAGSPQDKNGLFATAIVFLLFIMVYGIMYSVGAASLSYNYNLSVGTSGTMTVVYAVLSFMFSSLYYPFYALFVSPIKGKPAQKGGRR
jgi:uncharacterized MAPEG superfamily protein